MELTDCIFQVLDFINGEMEKIRDGGDPDGDNSQLISKMDAFLKQIKDENGIPQILHTKFEIVRNRLGKIIDFKLLDIRFLPAKGNKNPLERLK